MRTMNWLLNAWDTVAGRGMQVARKLTNSQKALWSADTFGLDYFESLSEKP